VLAVAAVVAAVADVSPRPVASVGRDDAGGDGASAVGESALSTSYWRHTGRLHVSANCALIAPSLHLHCTFIAPY
jgi:hypothetical protein